MKKLILYSFLLLSLVVSAQEKDKHLPKANEEFSSKKFTDAEADYRISQSNNPKKAIASYNLGNAIYRQNQPGEAKFSYEKAIKNAEVRPEKHKAFHNLGNVYMKEKNYTAAVEAYKNALRNNPKDEESRYNYALAKKMLKDNPPKKDDKKDKDKKDDKKQDKKDDPKKGGGKDKEDEKDKGKDPKDDKKEGDGKDKKDEKDRNDGQPKPKPGGISKQRVENLLDAVSNEEKKVQDKVNARKVQGKPVQTEKDW
ncbi:tetratricopeptide repeat protein [Flavobacterium sp. GT3R68]|uniref:tetratricopeptide repeat protein n=1 Tax=Flavobacterium sp. GT3R68 TaxID=2594437 RepID=UPI000F899E4C|nr:tetratricopeptide repeat protein [Flavobacterium sp. GT3R68]RTY95819.1 tetratricopeptide repeat protein [Flavobacterium sp. GSN2]TRW93591.1 tetratricopeptide repeat protein [Flavobacterium sp. GT3R68]